MGNTKTKNQKLFWILIRIPSLILFVIIILALIPQVSWLDSFQKFIQGYINIIAQYLLALVSILVTISPTYLLKLLHITQAEANMWTKQRDLDKREKKLVLLESIIKDMETTISKKNMKDNLDLVIDDVTWTGFGEISYPYIYVKCKVGSRFLLDLTFVDTKIKFEISIVKRSQGQVSNRWNIFKEGQLTHFTTISALKSNDLEFKFQWDSGYTRDEIKKRYASESEIELEFFPAWKLQTSDNRPVELTPSDYMYKVIPINSQLKQFFNQ